MKDRSDALHKLNEALKPFYGALNQAKEKRTAVERQIQRFGPDVLDRLQDEAEKMQRELSAGRGSFSEMRKLQLRVEEAQKARASREAAWRRWDEANKEVEAVEATMEKIRDQHRTVR